MSNFYIVCAGASATLVWLYGPEELRGAGRRHGAVDAATPTGFTLLFIIGLRNSWNLLVEAK